MTRVLMLAALAAGLTVSAQYEYAAGVALGLTWAAYAIPVMVDAYAVAALVGGRDVRAALGLLWCSITLGAVHRALHVPDAAATVEYVAGQVVMAVVISTVTAGVIWRVDVLLHADRARARDAHAEAERARVRAGQDAVRRAHAAELAAVRAEAEAARTSQRAGARKPQRAPRAVAARAPARDEVAARRALHARWLEDRTLTATQVADELGITTGAARAQLSRWAREATG
jgi:hypothetical protein